MTTSPHPLADRFFPALQDLVTAGMCIAVWWVPERFGGGFVATMCLIMLIELLTIQSVIVVPVVGVLVPEALGKYTGFVLALCVYAALAVAFSLVLSTWWPTLFFLWLLISRFGLPFVIEGWDGLGADFEREWALSTALWLLLIVPALTLPLPAVAQSVHEALPPPFVAPERWLAFAILYFLGLAAYKVLREPQKHYEPRLRSGVTDAERLEARAAGRRAQAARRARLEAMRRGRQRSDEGSD